MKKRIGFLFSMKFALIILGLFVLACIAGSVIPQGEIQAVYDSAYPGWSGLLLSTGLDDVFHSWWFIVLTLMLCVNLLGCNLLHFPAILKNMKKTACPPPKETDCGLLTGDPDALARQMGFRAMEPLPLDGTQCRYGLRNRLGCWGAWLTHLGILVIIAGFALGQIFTAKYTVYGVPGQTLPVGDTPYSLTIDDFQIDLREDDTVEQYTASLTLTDSKTGESWSGETCVNHPWDVQGLRLYQNSTGWAADVVVFKGEELLMTQTLCAGEAFGVKELPELQVLFRAFYPDYTQDETGMPASASGQIVNPGYLYMLYYQGELLGMNVLGASEKITVSDYSIIFTNPRSYTLIQIKRDPFTWLAGLGGGILLLALFIAFYLRPEELWLVPEGEHFRVYGRSRKGSLLYREKLTEKIKQCNEVSP